MGFAVVAEEVQRLADSSAQAAEDVAGTVKAFRAQIAEVGITMAAGRGKVRGVEGVAHAAAAALENIVNAVDEVEHAGRQVSRDATGNLKAAQAIQRAIAEVASQARSHAGSSDQVMAAAEAQGASTEEMAAQAAELNQAAERLRALGQGFKV